MSNDRVKHLKSRITRNLISHLETESMDPAAINEEPLAAAIEAEEPTATKNDYKGFFERVNKGQAFGWAADKLNLGQPLHIQIWEGSTLVASGDASIFRSDLKEAGIGDGYHSFIIPISNNIADGKEHILHATIGGSNFKLRGEHIYTGSPGGISGGITELNGLALRGALSSTNQHPCQVDVVADSIVIGKISVEPLTSNIPFLVEIPTSLANGQVCWFQLKLHDTGIVVAEAVFVVPAVSTPEDALQKYTNNFPGHMSHAAAARYASVSGQFSNVLNFIEQQDKISPQISLSDYIRQLYIVHRQVKIGINEQNRTPDCIRFPVFEQPNVSIVIPVHNKFWVTYNCLSAILLAPNKTTFEVIIVDDGSSDQTKIIGEFVKGITIRRHEFSQGFVKSSNDGAKLARGKYVVMLNNDTEPCAYWLDELNFVFQNFKNVGLVGAKFVYPNGKLQEAGGIVFPNRDVWNYGRNGNPADPRYNYTREVDYVSGACIMLERKVWDELNGFDEYFVPAYYEDNDLAFRVRAIGLKTYYAPFSTIIHFEGVSSGKSTTSGVKRYQIINEPKFWGRWAQTVRSYPSTLDPHIAKDRNVSLRALVLDVQPPQPDKDAGSYAAIQEMRLLQALGFKLTFAPLNLAYLGNYTDALQRFGVECVYSPFFTSVDSLIEERGSEFDVFYITRYSVADKYIDLIRQRCPRAKIVFNNADLHFLREIRAALAAKNSDALENAVRTRDIELSVMRRVDVTLSYTDVEAAVIMSHNLDMTRVARCPWVIEPDFQVPPFTKRSGLAFLGNFQHPPNEEAVRYFVAEIMPLLRQRLPGLVFHVYGSHLHDGIRALAADDVVVEGYVDDVASVYHSCRVFVAPLLSGAGIKGKVLGALASGTPTVMTSLACEGISIGRGTEALLADKPQEWIEAILSLYSNEERWSEMSSRAQHFTKAHFSFERGLVAMKTALAQADIYV